MSPTVSSNLGLTKSVQILIDFRSLLTQESQVAAWEIFWGHSADKGIGDFTWDYEIDATTFTELQYDIS